jgi:hypothetical protein
MQIGARPPQGRAPEFRTCRRKVQHHSEKKALEARQKMAETSPHAGHLEAYECPTCGCWHLGHTATTRARDLRNAHMQAEMDALSNDPET